jgi:16S rRNA (guanine527-N7)-methyltransferase
MKEFADKYYDLLTGEYAGINLTRIVDKKDFYNKQIIDSIAIYEQSESFKTALDKVKLLIDIGFGGGFPIVPLAEKLKDYHFVGIETRNKKVKVVGEISEKLNQRNTHFYHSRIENILIDEDCVCTLKAVGKVGDFLSKIKTSKKIKVFFYKGPNFYDLEKESLKGALRDWNLIEEKEIEVPGTDKRLIVGFENKNVPHGTISDNKLVKLSSIH